MELVMSDVAGLKARCGQALREGFAALDRDCAERGFWDPGRSTYVRALRGVRGDRGVEPPDDRYVPFGLAGALRAHRAGAGGNAEHLRRAAESTAALARRGGCATDNYFYGGMWALAEAHLTFPDGGFEAAGMETFARLREPFAAAVDLNYAVGLFGLSELFARTAEPTLRTAIESKADALARSVNPRGFPATGDPRAAYHQRLMYTTWGLCGAGRALGREDWLAATRRILEFVAAERYDADGGLRWHAMHEREVLPGGAGRFYPYGRSLYYECHQCFFIDAVELYMETTGRRDFVELRDRAASWIFGSNRWGIDLTAEGPPGLPTRCVTSRGRIGPPRNRFKGCYEVGAYLWALSLLVR
jgi:hypothetical protein